MSSTDDLWRAAWLRGGRISDLVWIGPDALAWCANLHVVILDVPSNRLRIPWFHQEASVNGVCCLSGHLKRQVFAFAERNVKPNIVVYAYPSMQKISECAKGTNFTYLATAFVGDFLISLASMAGFQLTLWAWRSGEKITSINTSIHDGVEYGQKLRASLAKLPFVAQIGNKSGKLCTWEITNCSSTAILRENKVNLPKRTLARDAAWCTIPTSYNVLAITDYEGHIYLTDSYGKSVQRIITVDRSVLLLEVEPPALCWFRQGIVLRTTTAQIRFYNKDEHGEWKNFVTSRDETNPWAVASHPTKDNLLFYSTTEGHLVQMHLSDDGTDVILDTKHFFNGKYLFMDFVHPWEEQLVAIDVATRLQILDAQEGFEIACINADTMGSITFMLSHPDYPLVVVTTDVGEVVFISLLESDAPKILGRFRMQRETLDYMKFSNNGRYLIAMQKDEGICYLFDVSLETQIQTLTRYETNMKIADILLFDAGNSLKLCLLQGSSSLVPIGCTFFLFELQKSNMKFKMLPYRFNFHFFYKEFFYLPGPKYSFFTTPFLSKHLRYFYVTNDWKDIVSYYSISSGNKIRQVKIHVCKNWFTTFSLDGVITVRYLNKKSSKHMQFVTHHRNTFGVVKALFNSKGDLLVSVGADGSVVAMKVRKGVSEEDANDKFSNLHEFGEIKYESQEEKIIEYLKSLDPRIVELLSEPIPGFAESSTERDITWVEWQHLKRIEEERRRSAPERERILLKFQALQSKLVELLDVNETNDETKKLPMSAFALDTVFRDKKMKAAKDVREEVRLELESDCVEMQRVTDWIQKKYWKPQIVFAQSICGIFQDIEVSNYTISSLNLEMSQLKDYCLFSRQIVKELENEDTIFPWQKYTPEELETIFTDLSNIKKVDELDKLDLIDHEEDRLLEEEEVENKRLLDGSTAYQYLDDFQFHYSQFKVYAFTQVIVDSYHLKKDNARLRVYFNNQFKEMFAVKEREMNLVQDRIVRLQNIKTDLQNLFNETVSEEFEYPKWSMKEKPENIIRVADDEITAKVYISPAQQELLDKQATEAERLRQLLLADDFPDRAIEAMMDGLLEVRWEDIIKKDIPKPECLLLKKDVKEYSDEDHAAVKRYERDVEHLMEERQKYRKILHSNHTKITALLHEGIARFNSRLEEFHLLKMKIESAIQQLTLRFVRGYRRHVNRMRELSDEDDMKQKIEDKLEVMNEVKEDIEKIQATEAELHTQYEHLAAKERNLEKKMKTDFQSLGKNAFAAINIQYKKRPRIILKTSLPDEVLDLGKSITSMTKFPYLSSEALEYIKLLGMLDIRPPNLPPSVEASHWDNLIILRRLKIDHELKLRSVDIAIEQAARVLEFYHEKQQNLRQEIDAITSNLLQARNQRVEDELDVELQMVLKMGQAEIPSLSGSVLGDWPNAVLVPKDSIDEINLAIVAAGREKLKMMERTLDFRKGIVVENWEHERLKTRIVHMQERLHYVRTAHVTRSIQDFLRRRAKGQKDDLSLQKMNRETRLLRRSMEKGLKDWEERLEELNREVMRNMKKNNRMDETIVSLNVDRCEMELKRDLPGEHRHKMLKELVYKLIAKRAALVRKLMKNHSELSELKRVEGKYCFKTMTTEGPLECDDLILFPVHD